MINKLLGFLRYLLYSYNKFHRTSDTNIKIVKKFNTIIRLSKSTFFSGEGILTVNENWLGLRISPHKSYLIASQNSKLILHGHFRLFNGASIYLNGGAKLELNNGYMNTNSEINCSYYIKIGENTIISDNVSIIDNDYHSIYDEKGNKINHSSPIIIGNNVWIGKNAIILKGVTIGDNSVIGAGSVVTKNIPSNSIAAGNPCKVIKKCYHWE